MTKQEQQQQQRDDAITTLRTLILTGGTVHAIVWSTVNDGNGNFTRWLSLYVLSNGQMVSINKLVAAALPGWIRRDRETFRLAYAGDAGDLVRTLGTLLYSEAYLPGAGYQDKLTTYELD